MRPVRTSGIGSSFLRSLDRTTKRLPPRRSSIPTPLTSDQGIRRTGPGQPYSEVIRRYAPNSAGADDEFMYFYYALFQTFLEGFRRAGSALTAPAPSRSASSPAAAGGGGPPSRGDGEQASDLTASA